MVSAMGSGGIRPPSVSFSVPEGGKRHKALTRLRSWERHKVRWRELRSECISGGRYADLLEGGQARPYELGVVRHVLLDVLTPRAVSALEHVLACERGFGRGGVVTTHAQTARWLRCSERAAGDAMRELVEVGLVEQRAHFRRRTVAESVPVTREDVLNGVRKHQELAPAYRTTPRCRAAIDRELQRRLRQGGRKCQPSETQSTLRVDLKGVRGRGRPERAFVAEVRAARRTRPPAREVATVIERLANGGVALGSPLTAERFAQRLRREGGADVGAQRAPRRSEPTLEEVQRDAWEAFEAREARAKGTP